MPSRGLDLLDLTRTLVGILPEVQSPSREIPLRQKVAYTAASLGIFLIGSQLPLYGVRHSSSAYPLYWMQPASRSNFGSVMAYGITTVLLSEWLFHFLMRLKILRVDHGVSEDQVFL